MRFFLLFISLLPPAIFFGQAPTEAWAKKIGAPGIQHCYKVVTDEAGNVYSSGVFESSAVDFDPGPGVYNLTPYSGSRDCFVVKLDSDGNFIWAKRFGHSGYDILLDMAIDTANNLYLTGEFENTVDFNPGSGTYPLTSVGSEDAYILKLDSNGNFVWAGSFGAEYLETGWAVDVDPFGDILLAGNFGNTVDFDPGPGVYNLTSVNPFLNTYVVKLDSDGNLIWAKNFGAVWPNLVTDVAGNVYMTGFFENTVDFDPGAGVFNITSNGSNFYDIYVTKWDANGNFVWANSWGGTEDDFGETVDVDPWQNVYVAAGISDGGGHTDGSVTKLNADGIIQWTKTVGDPTCSDGFGDVAVDDFGSVFLVGSVDADIDVDPGPGVHMIQQYGSNFDPYLLKLDTDGDFLWVKVTKASAQGSGGHVYVADDETIFVSGSYSDSLIFETDTLTPSGFFDGYVLKLNQCPYTSSAMDISTCDSFTSPLSGQVWNESGTYVDVLFGQSSMGCDSVIFYNIDVTDLNATVQVTDFEITAGQTGVSYQWIDCETLAELPHQDKQTFLASKNGSFAVVISQNGCSDTSECVNISGIGFDEPGHDMATVIYPNPFANQFQLIVSSELIGSKCVVSDGTGKEVFHFTIDDTVSFVDMSSFSDGIYFLIIGDWNVSGRIVKH